MKHTHQNKTDGTQLQSSEYWTQFLTVARMNRWNHIRFRAGVHQVSREQAVDLIMRLPLDQRGHIWANLQ